MERGRRLGRMRAGAVFQRRAGAVAWRVAGAATQRRAAGAVSRWGAAAVVGQGPVPVVEPTAAPVGAVVPLVQWSFCLTSHDDGAEGLVHAAMSHKGPLMGKGAEGGAQTGADRGADAATAVGPEDPSSAGNRRGRLASAGRTWERDVLDRMEAVHQAMARLADESRGIGGWQFALAAVRQGNGRLMRWRARRTSYSPWARVEASLATLPWPLAQWYRQAQDLAVELNHRDRALRFELGVARRLASCPDAG